MKLLLDGMFLHGNPLMAKVPVRLEPGRKMGKDPDRKLILKSMKLTAFLLVSMLMKVGATGFAQKITLSENNISLESVFHKITDQTGYVFFYSDDLLKGAHPVSLSVKDMPLEEVLNICFRNQPFVYYISNKTVAIKRQSSPEESFSQAKRQLDLFAVIVGTVTNSETGEPVTGATVMIKGTQTGTVVDKTGEFRLTTSSDQEIILVISFVGYETKEVKASVTGRMYIQLKPAPQALEEMVVVTGIFNRRADSYTGSTLTITNDDLKRVGNANVFQSLKNISPSMVLDNFTMGSNPNTMPDIRLRGTSTFPVDPTDIGSSLKGNYEKNPNEPLFILDGFEATVEKIYDLDINRIERITILKDATSKAIYGGQAANGVVVIETKRPGGSKGLVTYNGSLDIEVPDLTSYNLTNSLEKLEAEWIDGMYNATPFTDADEYIALRQLYNSRLKLAKEGLSTYWLAKPLREGIGQKHTLTVELGGKDLQTVADISYRKVAGVMKDSYRRNISGNLTTSYRVRNLLFRNIMSVNKNLNEESPYGTFNDYAMMNPYWRATNLDGSIPYYAEIAPDGTKYTNPLYNSTVKSKITADYFNFTDNFYLEWTMKPGLRAVARVGIDVKNSGADEFYPSGHTMFENFNSEELAKRKGSYQINNGNSNMISGDLNLNYTKEIGRHFLFANAGFNVKERKYNEVIHRVEGFSSDRMDNIIFGRGYAVDSRPVGIDGINRDLGFLGAFSYMYDNRFLSDLTVRTSASSQFGAEKRWAKFWSLGLGWNLHNEAFLKNIKALELFKLRGSLGSTGNPNFARNSAIATYNYYLETLYQGFPGSYLSNMANPYLQWETKMDYNVGFDARIHRLDLRFDYYESYTKNLITGVTLPYSTGFNTVKENLGEVKNSGVEVYASYLVWKNKRNFFTVNAGIETNKNKIVALSNAMKAYNERMDELAENKGTSVPVRKYEDGMSMNAIWAVPSLGIDPSTGNEVYVKRDGSTTYIWDPADMIVAGNSMPAYQGIFGFSTEYNGIGVNVTARYLGGGQLYNQTLVDKVENVDMSYNVDKRVLTGRWTKPGQIAQFKRLGTFSQDTDGDNLFETYNEKTRATTRFVQDRNELTIAAVNVYYLFNDRLLSKMKIQRLKLGFNMNEMATFSSIRIERGTAYPFSRAMSFSVSATF